MLAGLAKIISNVSGGMQANRTGTYHLTRECVQIVQPSWVFLGVFLALFIPAILYHVRPPQVFNYSYAILPNLTPPASQHSVALDNT